MSLISVFNLDFKKIFNLIYSKREKKKEKKKRGILLGF
jgi:hypothetical protein